MDLLGTHWLGNEFATGSIANGDMIYCLLCCLGVRDRLSLQKSQSKDGLDDASNFSGLLPDSRQSSPPKPKSDESTEAGANGDILTGGSHRNI